MAASPAGGVFMTAEIGVNHNGDLALARKLIDVAIVAGMTAVKFQKRTPEVCVPSHRWNELRDTPWGRMATIDYRRRIEFDRPAYDHIDAYCRTRGIDWYASVWDVPSLEFLLTYPTYHLKVPSAMLTHVELVAAVARSGRHTFVGTGMSTLEDVDRAVDVFRRHDCPFTLMHTVSSYPARVDELNLRCIPMLRRRYGCDVGYSGHEFGLLPTIVAVLLGATAVERHVTLDRSMSGSDHLASVEPIGLIKLGNYVRDALAALGDGVKRVHPSEQAAIRRLRYFEDSVSLS